MTDSNQRRHFVQFSTLALLLALASGCAASPATKLSDAALSGDPDAMWAEGQELARKGERLVKKGEQRMENARSQIRDGESKIRKGNELVAKSRLDYENAVASAGDARTPKVVEDEAKRLKTIGKRWEKALDMIRAGNELVEKGNKNIETGRSEVREGRFLIEKGSMMMRNSERSRRGDELLPIILRGGSTSE
ncbi:MAG: hypothetical protein KJO95_05775 [Gammaproteobacteria bacterium]|nr:hypothetical protein [Gammaproteobacteria bacterium]MBU2676016.1 hypothetical protein [Gammaproteobacteria bacterium]NNC56109.1 hypothetical protein [Woeseiaceae bacterium]NNL49752.1 hypothetical protein [Woeseiaceae bacterium]